MWTVDVRVSSRGQRAGIGKDCSVAVTASGRVIDAPGRGRLSGPPPRFMIDAALLLGQHVACP